MTRHSISLGFAPLFAVALFLGQAKAEDAKQAPVWLDSAPMTRRNVVLALDGGALVRVDVLGERLFRVRQAKTKPWTESALNRYGILTAAFPEVAFQQTEAAGVYTIATKQARLTVGRKDGSVALAAADGEVLTQHAAPVYQAGGGYDVRFALAKGERLYGLGDVSRENIMRRGGAYELWVRNVKSYIPIPVVLSSRGWGLLMNTTWRNTIDVGKSDPDRMICTAPRSDLDYYLFRGPDYRALLDTYTSLSGRPALLPIWGYAFTYVCNENIDAFNMINEALTFRREKMPCDVIGLEPGWMSKNYDFSTAKEWNPQRFPIPKWAPKGPHTFLGALARKGFKLSLWLCCDYDLGVYEEQQRAGIKPVAAPGTKPAVPAGDPDDFEKDEHLNKPAGPKKKVAAKPETPQTLEPWFDHLKKFVDQGVSAFKLDGAAQVIEHPGRAWGNGMTQECNWAYWRQPWLLKDTEMAAFRRYGQLRYRLLPYLYSTAAEAAETGYPVMRAMSMVYPDDPAWDTCLGQYMLGDSLLVSAFSKEVRLPEGTWFDFWSGKPAVGPARLPVEVTPNRGGALLVKGGAILPTWPPCDHVEKGWSPEVGLLVYPAARSSFTLYEDDGVSLGYRKGECAKTRLTCETAGTSVTLTIGGRQGRYAGMPATRDFTATIRLPARPKAVALDGAAVTGYQWNDAASAATVKIPACGQAARVLTLK